MFLETLSVSFSDAVQILVLYVAVYWLLKRARGSRFGQAMMGVGVMAAVLIGFMFVFRFEVLAGMLKLLLLYLAVSSVVIFQPEIRRLLPAIGSFKLFGRSRYEEALTLSPPQLADSIITLSRKRLGALVAVERGIALRAYMDSGIPVDAVVTPELLMSVFTPPLPLHDGGVIIRHGRLAAAHCIFPVSNQGELIGSGMRHRAAVGLTEETDALVIVVSEETGKIAVAHNGSLHRYPDDQIRRVLIKWIRQAQNRSSTAESKMNGWLQHPLRSGAGGVTSAVGSLFRHPLLKLLALLLAALVYFSWRAELHRATVLQKGPTINAGQQAQPQK